MYGGFDMKKVRVSKAADQDGFGVPPGLKL